MKEKQAYILGGKLSYEIIILSKSEKRLAEWKTWDSYMKLFRNIISLIF